MDLVTEIKLECTCENKLPDLKVVDISGTKAIKIDCETCGAGLIRTMPTASEDEVFKRKGYLEER